MKRQNTRPQPVHRPTRVTITGRIKNQATRGGKR